MREVCFLLVDHLILRVYFGTATRVPDSVDRWETIWEHRDEITEIVHSHPGDMLAFSNEDLTTMEAVEAGTGKTFLWSIVTSDGYLSRRGESGDDHRREDEPWWLGFLRQLSYGETFPAEKAGHFVKPES